MSVQYQLRDVNEEVGRRLIGYCFQGCCCRFCCGAPTTDERTHAPVLHDASQIGLLQVLRPCLTITNYQYERVWCTTHLAMLGFNHSNGRTHSCRFSTFYLKKCVSVKLSINNHIVRLVHKNHIIRTRLMYHAACKVEFQPFKRSYSQLTFFNFYQMFEICFIIYYQEQEWS